MSSFILYAIDYCFRILSTTTSTTTTTTTTTTTSTTTSTTTTTTITTTTTTSTSSTTTTTTTTTLGWQLISSCSPPIKIIHGLQSLGYTDAENYCSSINGRLAYLNETTSLLEFMATAANRLYKKTWVSTMGAPTYRDGLCPAFHYTTSPFACGAAGSPNAQKCQRPRPFVCVELA